MFLLGQFITFFTLDPCKHCTTQLQRESSAGQHSKQPKPAEEVQLVHRELHLGSPSMSRKTDMKEARAVSHKRQLKGDHVPEMQLILSERVSPLLEF